MCLNLSGINETQWLYCHLCSADEESPLYCSVQLYADGTDQLGGGVIVREDITNRAASHVSRSPIWHYSRESI